MSDLTMEKPTGAGNGQEPSAVPILTIEDLDKVFLSEKGNVTALQDVGLSVTKGEFVCLLGASGCGKSTLLRIIGGFEDPTAGSAEIYGSAIQGPGPDRGMVFQDYALFPWLTVEENIAFGPKHQGLTRAQTAEVTGRFMDMVGLADFRNTFPNALSGGMKQRVAIARVLANDADILLMDEPFAALDALTRAKLQEELLEIWERTRLTIIFVTHSVEEAVILSDRIVVMGAGPGHIESDIKVDLSRPRDPASIPFNDVRRDVSNQLRSHIAPTHKTSQTADA